MEIKITALALIKKNEIVNRVAQGHKLKDISAEIGISPQAISKQLKDDPDYQAAKVSYHTIRLDDAEEKIEQAIDQVDVARARAVWQSRSWRAEREIPELWGGKPTIVIANNDPSVLPNAISDLAESLLDQLRTVSDGK